MTCVWLSYIQVIDWFVQKIEHQRAVIVSQRANFNWKATRCVRGTGSVIRNAPGVFSVQVQQIRNPLTYTFSLQQNEEALLWGNFYSSRTKLKREAGGRRCSLRPCAAAAACLGGAGHFFLGYSCAHTAFLRSGQNIAMARKKKQKNAPPPTDVLPQTRWRRWDVYSPRKPRCCGAAVAAEQRWILRRGIKHCPSVHVFVCVRVWSGGNSDAVKWTTLPLSSFSIAPLPLPWLCLFLLLHFLLRLSRDLHEPVFILS